MRNRPNAPRREQCPVSISLPSSDIAPNFTNSMASSARFDVAFEESSATVRPGPPLRALQAHRLAAAGESLDRMWRILADHPARAHHAEHEERALSEAAARGAVGTAEATLGALTLMLMVTNPQQLRERLEPELPGLWDAFPGMTLWLASVSDTVLARLSTVRLLFQMQVSPELVLGEGGARQRSLSAQSLSSGVSFADVVQPVFLIFSPAATGYAAPWMPHAFALEFGAVVDLRIEASVYWSRVLEPKATESGRPAWVNDVPKEHLGSLLAWWVDRISKLYDIASDPTRFSDAEGRHDVMGQMAFLLTAERALSDLGALSALPRIPAIARLGLTFDLLDKLETLLGYGPQSRNAFGHEWGSGHGFTALLNRRRCLPMLERNLGQLPLQVRALFSKRAAALFDEVEAEIADGVLESRLRDGAVLVGAHADTRIPFEQYAGRVVRAVRNSSHGLLDQLAGREADVAVTHTGALPAALPELAAMIAFAMFADPERLWRMDVLSFS